MRLSSGIYTTGSEIRMISLPRGAGKTFTLIREWLTRPEAAFVCITEQEAERVRRLIEDEFGASPHPYIHNVLTPRMLPIRGRIVPVVLLDNADIFIKNLTPPNYVPYGNIPDMFMQMFHTTNVIMTTTGGGGNIYYDMYYDNMYPRKYFLPGEE